ncbi:MAG: long-chain fatty acid--CoA ligase [Saprospiraceae bacterium]|nr:long-chain fatty acid--CoA ligase [Saprospiraceae bacterium]
MSEKRLFDYLHEQLAHFPQSKAFGCKSADGSWQYLSTAEIAELANRLSLGLLNAGLKPGDKVATVVYRTTPAWVILDFALSQIGVLNVPMYPTISVREYVYILNEAEVRCCFVGDGDLYDKVAQAREKSPAVNEVFTFDPHPSARHWETLLAPSGSDFSAVEQIRTTIRPDDLATLIYTSGTTGDPKGVMLTHRNITYNVDTMRPLIPLDPGDRALSFLPISHIFERAVVYAYTAYGASVSFTGTDNLGGENGDFKAIKPHFFTAVPRLLEKVYERILEKGLELKGPKRAIFFWALGLTDHWAFEQNPGFLTGLQRRIADRLVFSKWRDALGGHIRGVVTGASPCPLKIMRTFNAAGIPLREGYGMSEAAPALSFSRYESKGALLGTVGTLLEGVEAYIEPGGDYGPGEGEIIATSPGIMLGYFKQPEKTAEVLRFDGGKRWLCTGDVGRFVDGPGGKKFLQITDRKKELLKTSGGKYVAPAPLESRLKEHRLVEQAMVVGNNLKFVSALIVPAQAALRDWCEHHEIGWTTLAEMVRHPRVLERYQMLLDRINPDFGRAEQIKKFVLLPDIWEPVRKDGAEGELTPTLKLKRRVIEEKFKAEIAGMYV